MSYSYNPYSKPVYFQPAQQQQQQPIRVISYEAYEAERSEWLKRFDQYHVKIQELKEEKKHWISKEVVSLLTADLDEKNAIIENKNSEIVRLNKEIGNLEGRVDVFNNSKEELVKLAKKYGKLEGDMVRAVGVNDAALVRSTLESFKKRVLDPKSPHQTCYLRLGKDEVENAAAIENAYNLFLLDNTNPLSVYVQKELISEGIDADDFVKSCMSSYSITSIILHNCINAFKITHNLNQYLKDIVAVPQFTPRQVKCIEILANVIPI